MGKDEGAARAMNVKQLAFRGAHDRHGAVIRKKQKAAKKKKNRHFKRLKEYKKLKSELDKQNAEVESRTEEGAVATESEHISNDEPNESPVDGGVRDGPSNRSQQVKHSKNSRKTKVSAFAKEEKIAQETAEQHKREREKQELEKKAREKQRKKMEKSRKESAKAYRKVNENGQPRLKYKLQNILEKLQKE